VISERGEIVGVQIGICGSHQRKGDPMRKPRLRDVVALLLLLPLPLFAAEPSEVERGDRLYQIHCMNCHGEDGRGHGPLRSDLRIRPTDLTRIARRNGGVFPQDEVLAAIDGRQEVRGHGLRHMPVWGLTFRVEGKVASQEEDVRVRLRELAAYLRSIQRD
jgi:mono/diheme cytochrome c family protein